jgi:hypothetical protein
MTVFMEVFDKYAESAALGEKPSISQKAFIKLCGDLQLISEKKEMEWRLAYASFYKTMRPQPDEVHDTRHLHMTFLEFLEAFSRAVDYCQTLPKVNLEHMHWYVEELDVADWLLDMKLEYVVPNMLLLLTSHRRAKVRTTLKTGGTVDVRHQQGVSIERYTNLN